MSDPAATIIDAAASHVRRADGFDDLIDEEAASSNGATASSSSDESTATPSTFDRVDLGPVLAGDWTQPTPELLTRTDGAALLYAGQINGIHGDSGTGKGWVACTAIAEVIRSGQRAMLIDLEDTPTSIVARLRLLGLDDAQISAGLDYRRPQEPFTITAVARLCADVVEGRHALVVIDSLGEAFALAGVDENKDSEVGPWLRNVARPLADTGAAVLLVDHSTKSSDNPLHPSGSKRKRAAIGGASYLIEAVKPLTRDDGGRLKVTCAKDRHGHHARGEVVAHVVLRPKLTGGIDVEIYAPDPPDPDGGADVAVVVIAAQVVRIVKDAEVPLSKSGVREHLKVKASTDRKKAAVEYAVNSGALAIEDGPRGAHILTYAHPLEVPSNG